MYIFYVLLQRYVMRSIVQQRICKSILYLSYNISSDVRCQFQSPVELLNLVVWCFTYFSPKLALIRSRIPQKDLYGGTGLSRSRPQTRKTGLNPPTQSIKSQTDTSTFKNKRVIFTHMPGKSLMAAPVSPQSWQRSGYIFGDLRTFLKIFVSSQIDFELYNYEAYGQIVQKIHSNFRQP